MFQRRKCLNGINRRSSTSASAFLSPSQAKTHTPCSCRQYGSLLDPGLGLDHGFIIITLTQCCAAALPGCLIYYYICQQIAISRVFSWLVRAFVNISVAVARQGLAKHVRANIIGGQERAHCPACTHAAAKDVHEIWEHVVQLVHVARAQRGRPQAPPQAGNYCSQAVTEGDTNAFSSIL